MRVMLICFLLLASISSPVSAQEILEIDREVRGALASTDRQLPDGRYFDEYRFQGVSDKSMLFIVSAERFDARITLTGPDGEVVLQAASLRFNSITAKLRKDGEYRLIVFGDRPGSLGDYSLRIRRATGLRGWSSRPTPGLTVETITSVPRASRVTVIERPCLSNGTLDFGQIHDRLRTSLGTRGYDDTGLFLTPRGFGIATQFERVSDSGKTIRQDRWSTAPFFNSLWQVLTGETAPGRYRSFIFVYESSIAQQSAAQSFPTIIKQTESDTDTLPSIVRRRHGGPDHSLKIFVYEYLRRATNAPAQLATDGISASQHLQQSELAPGLRAICGG